MGVRGRATSWGTLLVLVLLTEGAAVGSLVTAPKGSLGSRSNYSHGSLSASPVQPSTTPILPFSTTTTTSPSPTTEVVMASIRCQPSGLRIGIGPPVSPETGEHPLLLTLTNEGRLACYLDGYPSIALYDANKVLLPLSYEWHGYQTIGPAPRRVVLAPSHEAFVMVAKYRCDSGDKDTAVSLHLIPPDDTGSMTVSIQGLQDLSYCGPGDPGSELDISPVEPTAAATAAFDVPPRP
jgi:hypothetical protein